MRDDIIHDMLVHIMNVTRTVYAPSCSSWAWDPDTLPSTNDNRLRLADLTPSNKAISMFKGLFGGPNYYKVKR